MILPATLMIIHLTHMTQIYTLLSKLKKLYDSLFTWFKENHTKPNGDKYHLLVITEKSQGTNKSKRNKNYSV